jgi:hypothetical protein
LRKEVLFIVHDTILLVECGFLTRLAIFGLIPGIAFGLYGNRTDRRRGISLRRASHMSLDAKRLRLLSYLPTWPHGKTLCTTPEGRSYPHIHSSPQKKKNQKENLYYYYDVCFFS